MRTLIWICIVCNSVHDFSLILFLLNTKEERSMKGTLKDDKRKVRCIEWYEHCYTIRTVVHLLYTIEMVNKLPGKYPKYFFDGHLTTSSQRIFSMMRFVLLISPCACISKPVRNLQGHCLYMLSVIIIVCMQVLGGNQMYLLQLNV